jgi:hypothetical protein
MILGKIKSCEYNGKESFVSNDKLLAELLCKQIQRYLSIVKFEFSEWN